MNFGCGCSSWVLSQRSLGHAVVDLNLNRSFGSDWLSITIDSKEENVTTRCSLPDIRCNYYIWHWYITYLSPNEECILCSKYHIWRGTPRKLLLWLQSYSENISSNTPRTKNLQFALRSLLMSPRTNGRIFADDIFKCICMNEIFYILISISIKFVSMAPTDNKSTLVQFMTWHRIGDKP